MARTKDREKAIALRKTGMSYSQIKDVLGISKSTLSGWLKDLPLSPKRLDELRNTERQIEKSRQTKLAKKEARVQAAYRVVSRDIRSSKDSDFIAGFYLYWGEGTKTAEYTVSLTNSDPAMVRCFVSWLEKIGVKKSDMRVKLHLYTDQNEKTLKKFWVLATGINVGNFNKSYIKESRSDSKTYKGMFQHGTCVVAYHDRDMRDYVLAGVRFLQDTHAIDGTSKIR